jgi:GTP-binding protein
MIVDEVTIHVRGGDGGRGKVAFGETNMDRRPTGSDGGNGGNVYLEVTTTFGDLSRYRFEKDFKAPPGALGQNHKQGQDGEDVFLPIPRGTIVKNLTTGEPPFEMLTVGEKVLVAKGGLRGRGNRAFSHARASEPRKFEMGRPGYDADLFLELQLIADIGLVGLPNAGKSSLLNALTGAKSKVGAYKFTTLDPSLGILAGSLVMADIPGIIEGASEGKGLGSKFLRHVQRTKIIVHCISLESDDLMRDYEVIRGELAAFDKNLAAKPELILLTKTDLVSSEDLKKKVTLMKKVSKNVTTASVYDDESLTKITKELSQFFAKQTEAEPKAA